MNPIEEVLVFSSTDDVVADNFVVPILAAPLDLLPGRAAEDPHAAIGWRISMRTMVVSSSFMALRCVTRSSMP